jgi:hypothetical protein
MPLRIFDVAIKPLLLRGVSPTSYNLSLVVGVPFIYANPIYGNNWWIEITENLRYRLPRRGGAQVEYLPLGRILAKSLFALFYIEFRSISWPSSWTLSWERYARESLLPRSSLSCISIYRRVICMRAELRIILIWDKAWDYNNWRYQ